MSFPSAALIVISHATAAETNTSLALCSIAARASRRSWSGSAAAHKNTWVSSNSLTALGPFEQRRDLRVHGVEVRRDRDPPRIDAELPARSPGHGHELRNGLPGEADDDFRLATLAHLPDEPRQV